MNTIEKNLTDWGKAKQEMPQNPELMKSQVMAKLSSAPMKPERAPMHLPWMSMAFAGLAALVLIFSSVQNNHFASTGTLSQPISNSTGNLAQNQIQDATPKRELNPAAKSAPAYPSTAPNAAVSGNAGSALQENAAPGMPIDNTQPYYPPVPPTTTDVPSKDNREYLKTSYSADIKTRNVQNLSAQIQTTIVGLDGRVDQTNDSQDSGYISFVVPADKLAVFKTQIKNLAGARFYTETQSSENLLSQKVQIENQQTDTQKSLDQLNASLTQLNQTHTQTVASLRGQISSANASLKALQNEPPTTLNRAYEIQTQEQNLQNQIKDLQNRLAQENSSYNTVG